MGIHFEATDYGRRMAKERGNDVPARAVRALEAGDWEGFRRVYCRSKEFRFDLGTHAFDGGDQAEECLLLSYDNAVLGALRLRLVPRA